MVHVLWAPVSHRATMALKNRVKKEILTQIPKDCRDSWASLALRDDEVGLRDRRFARKILQRVIRHINGEREDAAFALSTSTNSDDTGVRYIYHDNTVSCVYEAAVTFNDKPWTVTDPTHEGTEVTLAFQVGWSSSEPLHADTPQSGFGEIPTN